MDGGFGVVAGWGEFREALRQLVGVAGALKVFLLQVALAEVVAENSLAEAPLTALVGDTYLKRMVGVPCTVAALVHMQ